MSESSDGRPTDAGDEGPSRVRSTADGDSGGLAQRYTLARAVAVVAALALLVRLVALGGRPFHYDEARVAYWSLHYLDTGTLAYRPIVHGPFVQLVNAWLFAAVGASDFVARLPVALAGGLLPAAAYLYRGHLRDSEVVALALFLAFNSIFVYYSRFLRSDMLLVAFMFAGFGFVVRYYDTRKVRYLYGAGLLVALGLTTKENGLVYLLTWLGATALLVDHALYPPRGFRSGFDRIRRSWVGRLFGNALALARVPLDGRDALENRWEDPRAVRRKVGLLTVHLLAAAVLAVVVLVFFYADRGAGIAGIERPYVPASAGDTGLWEVIDRPLQWPGYAVDTLTYAFDEAIAQWGSVSGGGANQPFLDKYAETLFAELGSIRDHALVVGVLGALGFVWERYATGRPRNLVMFMSYCGLASLVGYSLKNDPGTGYWLTIHIVLPMTVPAAVGASRLYRWGGAALANDDAVGVGIVVVLLVALGGQMAFVTAQTSYVNPTGQDNGLVQFAQADADFRDAAVAIEHVSDSSGTDALIYVTENHSSTYELIGNEPTKYRLPTCVGTEWTGSLPFPWYFMQSSTNVSCERQPAALRERIESSPPPMIIVEADDPAVPREHLSESYSARTFDLYRDAHAVTVYVHADYVDEAPGWSAP